MEPENQSDSTGYEVVESSHLPQRDIEAVARQIRQLPPDDAMEASLSLLSSLLPYQLRLGVEADKNNSESLKALSQEFTEYLTALRDALLNS